MAFDRVLPRADAAPRVWKTSAVIDQDSGLNNTYLGVASDAEDSNVDILVGVTVKVLLDLVGDLEYIRGVLCVPTERLD